VLFFFFSGGQLTRSAFFDENAGFAVREDWIKKACEAIRAAQAVWPTQKPRN